MRCFGSTGLSPYEALQGSPPPTILSYITESSRMAAVDGHLKTREKFFALWHFNLNQTQNRMKQQADRKRRDKSFEVGRWVYLKLQPYRRGSVVSRKRLKLCPRYYGPYQIIKKVEVVAYELMLPVGSKVHPIFHVSQLREKRGEITTVVDPELPITEVGLLPDEFVVVIDRRMRQKGNHVVVDFLVQWSSEVVDSATWEEASAFKARFPDFDLGDKINL